MRARAAHSAAWQKGSPPERVRPSVSGLPDSSAASSATETSRPPAGSWVPGLWQPGQRWGQPWVKTVNRRPGPSTMESDTVLAMRMALPPSNSRAAADAAALFALCVVHHLEDIELQVEGLVGPPQHRMVGGLVRYSTCRRRRRASRAASPMVLVNSSGVMKWEQEQVAR